MSGEQRQKIERCRNWLAGASNAQTKVGPSRRRSYLVDSSPAADAHRPAAEAQAEQALLQPHL